MAYRTWGRRAVSSNLDYRIRRDREGIAVDGGSGLSIPSVSSASSPFAHHRLPRRRGGFADVVKGARFPPVIIVAIAMPRRVSKKIALRVDFEKAHSRFFLFAPGVRHPGMLLLEGTGRLISRSPGSGIRVARHSYQADQKTFGPNRPSQFWA